MKTNISEIIKLFFIERGFENIEDIDLFEVGALDSMTIIDLVVYLEEVLNTSFDSDQMIGENFKNLNAIINFIKKNLN